MSDFVLGVVSDIHGNIRALDAVVSDLERRGIDRVVNLGDCLYGPFDPRLVAERLIDLGWPTVAGNEDRCLVQAQGPEFTATARFTHEQLFPSHMEWLTALPSMLDLGQGILAVHGTPRSDREYLLHRPDGTGGMREATEEEIAAALDRTDAWLTLCGHDHLPRVSRLNDGRTVLNPGSVGCPAYSDDHPVPHAVENGTPHARYAIVTLGGGRVDVEPVAIAYDWDAAAAEAESNGFPEWATWITTGCAVPA